MFHALINDQPYAFSSLEEKFRALEKTWLDWIDGSSIIKYNHFAYLQIIGCGEALLPILIAELEKGSNNWFVAIKAITGLSIDTPEMHGKPKQAREAWINWFNSKTINHGT